MKKNDIKVIPPYGVYYANLADERDLLDQLHDAGISLFENRAAELELLGNKIYAPGKWTVKQIIEHIIDAERIFQYRALCIARQDKTDFPGFDEDMYAAVSRANDRTIESLLNEFRTVRNATVSLYQNLDNDQLQYAGTANGQATSVLALGFMIIGHAIHHFNVITERYFPLNE